MFSTLDCHNHTTATGFRSCADQTSWYLACSSVMHMLGWWLQAAGVRIVRMRYIDLSFIVVMLFWENLGGIIINAGWICCGGADAKHQDCGEQLMKNIDAD